jgi:hypothetical protein
MTVSGANPEPATTSETKKNRFSAVFCDLTDYQDQVKAFIKEE